MNFNKFYFLFLGFVLVMASLAVATTVTTKSVSDEGTLVIVTGTCVLPALDVSLQAAIGPNTVWVDQVKANNSKGFTAQFTPPQKGTYSIYAACQGEQGTSATFCVGSSSECTVTTQDEKKASPSPGAATPGGSGSCISQWNCTATWSVCNASLQQTRTCTDLAKCNLQKLTKVENRTCTLCEESWSCSASWSSCSNGFQTRKCFDDNQCGTTKKKPVEKQACTAAVPSKSATVPPSSGGVAPSQAPEVQKPSFWEQYQGVVLGIASALLLLIVVGAVVFVVRRQKHREYNYDELKEWIHKEQELGTSEEDIKKILQEHTGWKAEELEGMFAELKARSGQMGEPQ